MPAINQIQIGKQGITDNFIETLKNHFKRSRTIKISVLKNARPEGKEGKIKVKEYAETLLKSLGNNYSARVIGFTIALKKWRHPFK